MIAAGCSAGDSQVQTTRNSYKKRKKAKRPCTRDGAQIKPNIARDKWNRSKGSGLKKKVRNCLEDV